MGNKCDNIVNFSGNKEQIEELVSLIGDDFDFNALIPLTNDSREEALEKWGCQHSAWDVGKDELGDGEVEYCFYTDNVPPQYIYQKIRSQFPDIVVDWFYEEPGCNLRGHLGSLTSDFYIIKINLSGEAYALIGPFDKEESEERLTEYSEQNDGQYNCIRIKTDGGSKIELA